MVKLSKPLISIIIPIYNGSNYMRDAIDSALTQNYNNIEVIVINDGSVDDTEEIAKSYGDKIRYFKKENGGVSTALNLGLREMKGEFFSWLSHDDVYYPDKIKNQVDFLSNGQDDNVILYSDYDFMDEKSKTIKRMILDQKMLKLKPEYALLRGCINGITLLVPKKAFIQYGFFDENLRCTQDYELWNKMMRTYKFIHMPNALAKYRVHEAQDSKKSPNVTIEGNSLWIDMMINLPVERKKMFEGSEFNFYKEMVFFLRRTPYREAMMFANKKANEILTAEGGGEVDFTRVFIFPTVDELKNKIRFAVSSPHKFFKKYFS